MCRQPSSPEITMLRDRALQLSIDAIRATTAAGSGHPTSCMSSSELIATLFFRELSYDAADHFNANNDRFILSKGHAVPVLYALYKQLGIVSDEELLTLRQVDSVLEGHPTPRFVYNETATGSLGQGLAVGVGMALNARHDKLSYKTVVLMGDGEIAEGSVWEAAALASHYSLYNLVGIVDVNRLGQAGESLLAHKTEQYRQRFAAFGWETMVIDGHVFEDITKAFDRARHTKNKPFMIIAKTYKGHGLSLCQDKIGYHGKPFSKQERDVVCAELRAQQSPQAQVLLRDQACQVDDKTSITNNYPLFSQVADVIAQDHREILSAGKKCSTRKAFGFALAALGRTNKDVMVLDADVKNSTFTDIFEKEFPERFVQCFIAEQLMIGVAVGLQIRGKVPFAATFGAFFARAHDQLRMAGIGRNALRLCGSHCGVSIGEDGPSQMALEDIAMIAGIPGSIIFYPSDAISTYKMVFLMAQYHDGISYLRSTRAETSVLYAHDEEFFVGGCKILRQSGQDQLVIVAAGITVHEALKASELLAQGGVSVAIIDLYSIKPVDYETIIAVARKSGNKVITVEDHYRAGGIGQIVADGLINTGIQLKIMAVEALSRSGSPEKLLALAKIDAQAIVAASKEFIAKK